MRGMSNVNDYALVSYPPAQMATSEFRQLHFNARIKQVCSSYIHDKC